MVRNSKSLWVPPAPSVRINTVRPSWPPLATHGNCANASADYSDVIGGGVGSSVSRPGRNDSGSPVPPGPWSQNASNG